MAGAHFSWALDISGAQIGLSLEVGVHSNWTVNSESPNRTGLLGQVGLQTVKAQFELTLTFYFSFLPFPARGFFILSFLIFSPGWQQIDEVRRRERRSAAWVAAPAEMQRHGIDLSRGRRCQICGHRERWSMMERLGLVMKRRSGGVVGLTAASVVLV